MPESDWKYSIKSFSDTKNDNFGLLNCDCVRSSEEIINIPKLILISFKEKFRRRKS